MSREQPPTTRDHSVGIKTTDQRAVQQQDDKTPNTLDDIKRQLAKGRARTTIEEEHIRRTRKKVDSMWQSLEWLLLLLLHSVNQRIKQATLMYHPYYHNLATAAPLLAFQKDSWYSQMAESSTERSQRPCHPKALRSERYSGWSFSSPIAAIQTHYQLLLLNTCSSSNRVQSTQFTKSDRHSIESSGTSTLLFIQQV